MLELIAGSHPVLTALEAGPTRVKRIMIDETARKRHAGIIEKAEGKGVKVVFVAREVIERRYPSGHHQGVLAEIEPHRYADLDAFLDAKPGRPRAVLVLDGVTDPQNLGAILRSAGAFGVDFIVLPKDRSAPVTPAVVKISAGASEVVPIALETNLSRAIDKLKSAGFWCYALEARTGNLLSDLDLKGDVALILGSEGKGLRRLVRETADMVCSIPAEGPIPSLNVASAATCALYEVFRQRSGKAKK